MKKLILGLLLFVIAACASGQTIDTSAWGFKADPGATRITDIENKAEWMGQDSGTVIARLQYLLNYPAVITDVYTDPDTSGIFRTTLDSIPITGKAWFDVNAYTADSTIFLCFDRTFPLHSVIPIPAGSHNIRQYSISVAAYGYLYKRTQTRKHSIEKNSY